MPKFFWLSDVCALDHRPRSALLFHFEPDQGPLTLGALHEARAQVALRSGQQDRAKQHFEQMERWYRSTDCSSLIQHCNQIARRWTNRRGGAVEGTDVPGISFLVQYSSRLTSVHEAPDEMRSHVVRGAMAKEGALLHDARRSALHAQVAQRRASA